MGELFALEHHIQLLTIKQDENPKTTWVAKARWVEEGRIWTSSGVTAGIDMGHGFLKHLVGDDVANAIRGIVEVSVHTRDDDPFAEFYHLE